MVNIGDFQSVIQLAAALNAAGVISDRFRNLARNVYEAQRRRNHEKFNTAFSFLEEGNRHYQKRGESGSDARVKMNKIANIHKISLKGIIDRHDKKLLELEENANISDYSNFWITVAFATICIALLFASSIPDLRDTAAILSKLPNATALSQSMTVFYLSVCASLYIPFVVSLARAAKAQFDLRPLRLELDEEYKQFQKSILDA